jgi:hypothetical protein
MNRMLVWLLVGSGVWCADGPTGDAVWRADGSPRDGVWWSGIAGFGGQKVHETIHWNRSSLGGTNSFDEPRQEDSLLFVWWNLHNLFDTVENSGPRDRDFLPKGPYKWDSKRYFTKLYAVGRGLAAAAGGRIPDAIGVCEVENADVLDDLERRWPPAWRLWRLHRDSPDGRGIDVAVWYNPDRLRVDSVAWIHPGQDYPTREALWIRWKLPDGTRLTWLWLHLPSQRAPSPKARADALADISAQISTPVDGITGDLNEGLDGPLAQWLRAHKFRPHYPSNLPGSFAYRGRLEALDGVWTGPSTRWRVRCTAIPYGLKRTSNGYQIRGSFEGLRYRGGASDHLPLRMEVVRN